VLGRIRRPDSRSQFEIVAKATIEARNPAKRQPNKTAKRQFSKTTVQQNDSTPG